MAADGFALTGSPWFRRFSVQRTFAELLGKRWMDTLAPVTLLAIVILYFGASVPGFFNGANIATTGQILAEDGLLALGMTVVILGGGIDLSVGSIYAVANGVAVVLFKVYVWPVPVIILMAIVTGVVCGSVNGLFISHLKTRPFITTLVTLLLFRSIAVFVDQNYSARVGTTFRVDALWDNLANNQYGGFTLSFIILLALVIILQFIITRTRFGWQITAMGASRTSARRAGMRLDRLGFETYVISGALAGLSGFFVANRVGSASQSTGQGYEFIALTAVIIGGVSLTGGKGTATRALIGAGVVVILYQGLLLQNRDANIYQIMLAVILILFTIIDLKYSKNLDRAIQKIFMVPAAIRLGELIDVNELDSVYRPNRALTDAEPIGLGLLDGPEDVVLDRQGRLYCGDRRGYVWQFSGPNLEDGRIFSRVGGLPLGLGVDAHDNIIVCVGGMGLYSIAPDGSSHPLATRTKRSKFRIRDDSPLRLTDDLDIAPDGKIYFSDASTRFDGVEYMFEMIEARPNGRVLCYDPATGDTSTIVKNMSFPNGICVAHDGRSILINSSSLYRVDRYWLEGPQAGSMEPFLENLPGGPDNINRASDGGYWLAFAAMRSPVFDLAYEDASFRLGMLKELAQDEWLTPNLNTSCVIKISESGEVVEALWDETQRNHSLITSMREYDGWLYLGGLTNNRVGRVKLSSASHAESKSVGIVVGGGSRG